MKFLLLSVLVASSFIGCGGKSTPDGEKSSSFFTFTTPSGTPNSLSGLWGVSKTVAGTTRDARFQFSATEMTAACRCTKDGKTAMVSVTVPIEVAANKITMNESKKDQILDGDMECSVETTQGGTVTYTITDLTMSMTSGGDTVEVTKLRD